MNNQFESRYLKTAQQDMEDIFDYIMEDNPTAAMALLNKFDKSISHLASNPEMGTIPMDERLKKLGYRILIVEKYLIFYVIKSNMVKIRRIIHGARQYSFLI